MTEVLFARKSDLDILTVGSPTAWTIGPQFAPQTSGPSNRPVLLTINANNTAPPALDNVLSVGVATYVVQIIGPDGPNASGVNLMQFGNDPFAYPGISTHRARGTATNPTAVLANDVVGHWGIHPRSTSDWSQVGPAYIRFFAGENFDDTHQGVYAVLATTPNGSAGGQTVSVAWQGTTTKLGGIDVAAPNAVTLASSGVLAGTSNTAGANFTFAASPGTGTGNGGDFIWTTAFSGSSGVNQNPLTEKLRLQAGGFLTGVGSFGLRNNVGMSAGGTQDVGLLMSNVAHFGIFFGSGAPTLSAAQGSLYLRSDGNSTSTRMYVNTNGSTTWTAVTTAA